MDPCRRSIRALTIARGSVAQVALPSWAGGALVATVVLTLYYLERVEGIHSLRLPMAFALMLAWWGRAYLLGRAARHAAGTLWDARPDPEAGRPADVLRTAMVAALGLWVWSWPLVAGSLAGFVGVALVLPLLSLRGAAAPSWLARAACEPGAGWRGFFRAAADNHGRRGTGVAIEGMMLAAGLGLTFNLYVTTAVGALLARSFAGLDVAWVEAFLSFGNTFVVLVVASVAFVLLEPVRASISAIAYVDGRVRAEGLDVRAAIEDAITHSSSRSGREVAARAALVLFALALLARPALAQAPPPAFPPPPMDGESSEPVPALSVQPSEPPSSSLPTDPGPMPVVALSPEDREVDARVETILGRSEFREFEDARGEGLRDLIERLLDWMLRPREDLPELHPPNFPSIALPGAVFFLSVGALLLLAVGCYLWLTRRKDRKVARSTEEAPADGDPRDRSPGAFLDDAAELADEGDLREAMRALYLATLVALDSTEVDRVRSAPDQLAVPPAHAAGLGAGCVRAVHSPLRLQMVRARADHAAGLRTLPDPGERDCRRAGGGGVSPRVRRVLVAAAVVFALGAGGVMCQRVGARGRYASAFSTYGAGPRGTRGLYLLTEELGASPARWAEDLGRLPEGAVLVALGSCDQLMRREVGRIERENLRAWVERGGVLVVAGVPDYLTADELGVELVGDPDECLPSEGLLGMIARAERRNRREHDPDGAEGDGEETGEDEDAPPDLEDIPDALRDDPAGTYDQLTARDSEPEARLAVPVAESLTGIAPVSMRRALRLKVAEDRVAEPLLRLDGPEGEVVGARIALGRGSVIALSSASALANRELRDGGGGVLFARLIRAYAPAGPVLFDEYHLGVGQRRSLMRYLRQVGLGAVVLQILLMVAFVLWRLGARFGGVTRQAPVSPGGTASYVDGVATLYQKAGDPAGAAHILVRRALARVAAHHHLSTSDPARMVELLTRRRREPVADVVAALERLDAEGAGPRGLAQLAAEVDRLLAEAIRTEPAAARET